MCRHKLRCPVFIIFIAAIFTQLSGCFGGDDDSSETSAWVRIDEPVDGFSTGNEYVTVEGNAAMRDGSYPEQVYWENNGTSGSLPQSTICLLACVTAFKGEVPLSLGGNTITVHLVDGTDSVNVSRYPQVVAGGKVVLAGAGGIVPQVSVTLSGERDAVTASDAGGDYLFSYLTAGSYQLSASLVPPQATGCLSFSPGTLDFEVNNDEDIFGLDFTATQLIPCYVISGRISASTNPDANIKDVMMTLEDAANNKYVIYSDVGGYTFWHLAAGSYIITPSDAYGGVYIPDSAAVTITGGDVTATDFVKVFN